MKIALFQLVFCFLSFSSEYEYPQSWWKEVKDQNVPDWAKPAWHLYVVRSMERASFEEKLGRAGVGTLIHYPIPPHMQKAYSESNFNPESYPIARQLAKETISLPIGPQLTGTDLSHSINVINQ